MKEQRATEFRAAALGRARSRTRAVLFDLDGTLVDTAPDMVGTLNELLVAEGRAPVPYALGRSRVSHGAIALVRLGFGDTHSEEALEREWRPRFLRRYAQRLAERSTLFPGFEAVLDAIEARGLPWGIVTNKPETLSVQLLNALGLAGRLRCLVGGDTLSLRKPHPLPLLYACERIGIAPHEALYVGDAQRDVQAAHAAGMRCVVARFGYLAEEDRPHEWGAEALIDRPAELLARLH